ncbi:MAG: ferrochelatase [Candidatus Sedimenticola sp. 1PA]
MNYKGPEPSSDQPECTGVLLTNLGTPDAPTTTDVRRYLKEFLSDPRVVEIPRLIWWLVLNGVILRTRPSKSAAAYKQVWTENGSPLLDISKRQADALNERLQQKSDTPIKVVLAMRYGNPSIAAGLEALREANARKIIVLPLYPQYSATTTASTFDAVSEVLRQWRWIPELRFINHYQDDPGYIASLAKSVREFWQTHGEPDRLLISFHGIPREYADAGDPYPKECNTTARLLTEALGIADDRCTTTFQSRLGGKEWLKPYTDETLKSWGAEGTGKVHVICPGFSADCLETIEEIGEENRDYFIQAGGGEYRYIPSLNDREDHIEALADLVMSHSWR